MKNKTPLLLLLIGIVLLWVGGVNGKLGTFLAIIFQPNKVNVNE